MQAFTTTRLHISGGRPKRALNILASQLIVAMPVVPLDTPKSQACTTTFAALGPCPFLLSISSRNQYRKSSFVTPYCCRCCEYPGTASTALSSGVSPSASGVGSADRDGWADMLDTTASTLALVPRWRAADRSSKGRSSSESSAHDRWFTCSVVSHPSGPASRAVRSAAAPMTATSSRPSADARSAAARTLAKLPRSRCHTVMLAAYRG